MKEGIEADAVMPSLGATLEWMKSVGGAELPTSKFGVGDFVLIESHTSLLRFCNSH